MAEIPLIMPKMSMTMEEGTIVAWHKKPGDAVKEGELVAEVLTDKVDMDVESSHDGVLSRIVAEVDDVVKVGEPIAFIESEGKDLLGDLFAEAATPAADETPAAGTPASEKTAEASPAEPAVAAQGTAPADGAVPPAAAAGQSGIIPASPLARKLAKDAGLDLASVTPTGPNGTVRVVDVRQIIDSGATPAASPAPAGAPAATKPAAKVAAPAVTGELYGDSAFQRTRKAVYRSMQPSAEVPQFTVYRSINLEAMALARKTSLKGIGWTAIVVRALALSLRKYPVLNGYWSDEGVVGNADIGVTVAVDTEHGLMVPVLLNPDQKTLSVVNDELNQLVEDARNRKIDLDMLSKATATVSNLGGMGIERFNALITPPQATALSVGAIQHIPVLNEAGHFEPELVIQLGLTVDHRVGDGADAARLLQEMSDLLSDPIRFLA